MEPEKRVGDPPFCKMRSPLKTGGPPESLYFIPPTTTVLPPEPKTRPPAPPLHFATLQSGYSSPTSSIASTARTSFSSCSSFSPTSPLDPPRRGSYPCEPLSGRSTFSPPPSREPPPALPPLPPIPLLHMNNSLSSASSVRSVARSVSSAHNNKMSRVSSVSSSSSWELHDAVPNAMAITTDASTSPTTSPGSPHNTIYRTSSSHEVARARHNSFNDRNKKNLGINTTGLRPGHSAAVPRSAVEPSERSYARLGPSRSHASSVRTMPVGSSGSKFFTKAGSSREQVASTTPLVSIGIHAKFFNESDTKTKLKLLSSSDAKFDEIIEFGFPIAPDQRDREYANSTRAEKRFSLDPSNVSAVPREMTLKITLSPPAMRADEKAIYGWQKELIEPSGALKSAKSIEKLVTPAIPEYEYTSSSSPISPSSITSSNSTKRGGGMKKVFGKLGRKQKPTGNPLMITSADMN
ncbi:hypothetical protein TRVA0_001S05534 [Trichomonascus vanleenenianus]|uniref:uncharacterized protein n=1 Tax=Trichomonascus vanleenenianus TaxID=2268995 RepID=UPI003EC955DB